jgi:hypothetical protein
MASLLCTPQMWVVLPVQTCCSAPANCVKALPVDLGRATATPLLRQMRRPPLLAACTGGACITSINGDFYMVSAPVLLARYWHSNLSSRCWCIVTDLFSRSIRPAILVPCAGSSSKELCQELEDLHGGRGTDVGTDEGLRVRDPGSGPGADVGLDGLDDSVVGSAEQISGDVGKEPLELVDIR